MAADNTQNLISGVARVVGNSVTPPNGFIQGNLIASMNHAGAGLYDFTLNSDISLQEYDLRVQLQGTTSGMAKAARTGSGVIRVSTFSGANAAADADFTLTIAFIRVGG